MDTLIEYTEEANKVHLRTHKFYPPLPDCPILMLSDQEKKERVKLFQNYIRYRLTNYSTAPYYSNPDDLQLMIDAYFDSVKTITIKAKGGDFTFIPFTMSGLVLFCGFCSRTSFFEMEKEISYTNVIKSARMKLEAHIEKSMQTGVSTAGNIFWLKNHGWIDKTEQTINQTIREVKVSINQSDTADLVNNI
jgi:hypothetical protein